MDTELIKAIDSLLFECKKGHYIFIGSNASEKEAEIVRTAIQLGLICEKPPCSLILTKLGIEVNSKGGYIKYQNDLAEKERIEKEMKQLQMKQLKGSIFQMKYWWLLLIINGIISWIITWIVNK